MGGQPCSSRKLWPAAACALVLWHQQTLHGPTAGTESIQPLPLPSPMIPMNHALPDLAYVTQPAAPAAVVYDPRMPQSPTTLSCPPLPDDWRHCISSIGKHCCWQLGAASATFMHPVTGQECLAVPTGPGPPHEQSTPATTHPGMLPGRLGRAARCQGLLFFFFAPFPSTQGPRLPGGRGGRGQRSAAFGGGVAP